MFRTRSQGFGLMETVIALGILTAVLGTSVGLARFSVRASADSQVRIVAYNLAQRKIEQIRQQRDNNWLSVGKSWLSDNSSQGTWCRTSSETKNYPHPPVTFTLTTACADVSPATPNNNIKKITITIAWSDQGVNKSIILETKLSNWKQF